jgi:hypothetical protein
MPDNDPSQTPKQKPNLTRGQKVARNTDRARWTFFTVLAALFFFWSFSLNNVWIVIGTLAFTVGSGYLAYNAWK